MKGSVDVGDKVHAKTFEGETASMHSLTINRVDVASEIKNVASEIKRLNTDKAEKGGSTNQKFDASEVNVAGSMKARWYQPNYDSGWVKDNNKTDHRTVFPHKLNYLPAQVMVYFSPTPGNGKAYPVMFTWGPETSGNLVTVEVTGTEIVLNVYHGQPLRGVWDAQTTRWTYYREGYWRVIALGGGP